MHPEDAKYTEEHEWVRAVADAEDRVRIGITDYAQQALGDIVYVQLPDEGEQVSGGEPMGELESTKSVSDLFAPVSGTVAAVNSELADHPELCNTDPYGDGWVVEITLSEPAQLDSLLSAAQYDAKVASD